MAFEAEYGPGILNASGLTFTIPITAAVAVGKFLVVSVHDASSTALTVTCTDTKGNTYTKDLEFIDGNPGAGLISGSVHQLRTKVTTALVSGNVITVTFSGAATRAVGMAAVYGDDISGRDPVGVGPSGNSGATTSSALATASATTQHANDLFVGTVGLVSSARVFTPTNGWTALTKGISTSGSGDRGVQQIYKYVAAPGPYTATGTLNSSSLWGIGYQPYAIADPAPPARSGRLYWYNTATGIWEPKPTLVSGVEKPWSYNGVLSL
jgi:hypothetical protein